MYSYIECSNVSFYRLEYMVAKVRLNLEEHEKELTKAEATVEGATNIRSFMPLFFVS